MQVRKRDKWTSATTDGGGKEKKYQRCSIESQPNFYQIFGSASVVYLVKSLQIYKNAISCQPVEVPLKLMPLFQLFHLALPSAFYCGYFWSQSQEPIRSNEFFLHTKLTEREKNLIRFEILNLLLSTLCILQIYLYVAMRSHIASRIWNVLCTTICTPIHSRVIHKEQTNLFC